MAKSRCSSASARSSGTLPDRVPIESSQRLFRLVEEVVDLALDTFADHE
mgnify:CR=1 FL=1|jgi:hypothetical protein